MAETVNAAEKKLRHSKQRDRIYEYLCSSREHPSAEMIYDFLKGELPNLSLGTVYRNLGQLEQMGKVVRVTSVDNRERYDAICRDHAHFVCSVCGRVIDLDGVDVDAVKALCNLNDGSSVKMIHLVLGGVCSDCSHSE